MINLKPRSPTELIGLIIFWLCVACLLAAIAIFAWLITNENRSTIGDPGPEPGRQVVTLRNAAAIPLLVTDMSSSVAGRVERLRLEPDEARSVDILYPSAGGRTRDTKLCVGASREESRTSFFYFCQTLGELEAAGWRMELTVGDIEGR